MHHMSPVLRLINGQRRTDALLRPQRMITFTCCSKCSETKCDVSVVYRLRISVMLNQLIRNEACTHILFRMDLWPYGFCCEKQFSLKIFRRRSDKKDFTKQLISHTHLTCVENSILVMSLGGESYFDHFISVSSQ